MAIDFRHITKPTVFKQQTFGIKPSEKLILSSLRDTLLNWLDSSEKMVVNIFWDGEILDQFNPEKIEPFIPKEDEVSFAQYHKKRLEVFEGKPYYLYVSHLLGKDGQFWKWRSQLYKDLFDSGEKEIFSVNIDLILGYYDQTPAYIHRDDMHVMYHVLKGEKNMHFWEEDLVISMKENLEIKKEGHTGSRLVDEERAHIERYLENSSFVSKLIEGDLLYWPGEFWHLANQELNFSATYCLNWKKGESIIPHIFPPAPVIKKTIEPSIAYQRIEPSFVHFFLLEGVLAVTSNGHNKKFPLLDSAEDPWGDWLKSSTLQMNDEMSQVARTIFIKIMNFLYQTRAIEQVVK